MTITVQGHLRSRGAAEIADPEVAGLVSAAAEVHRVLGPGYLKPVYLRALELELELRSILHSRQVEFPLVYKGRPLATRARADLVCHGSIILQVIAAPRLDPRCEAEVVGWLRFRRIPRALICNFGGERLEVRHLVYAPGAAHWQGDD